MQANSSHGGEKEAVINDLGTQITGLDQIYHSYDNHEVKYEKKTKSYKRDLYDLIEYVKQLTLETSILRKRIRAAESVICQLRSAGKQSVESMLDTLFILRKKQEKLDEEAENLRMEVQSKEALIKRR